MSAMRWPAPPRGSGSCCWRRRHHGAGDGRTPVAGLFGGAINTPDHQASPAWSPRSRSASSGGDSTQPFAGMVADRIAALAACSPRRPGNFDRVGTALIPHMTTTWGLVLAIGVLGGRRGHGRTVRAAGTARLTTPERRGIATGSSMRQFVRSFLIAPLAQIASNAAGWGCGARTGRDDPAGPCPRPGCCGKFGEGTGEAGAGSSISAAFVFENDAEQARPRHPRPELPCCWRRVLRLRLSRRSSSPPTLPLASSPR